MRRSTASSLDAGPRVATILWNAARSSARRGCRVERQRRRARHQAPKGNEATTAQGSTAATKVIRAARLSENTVPILPKARPMGGRESGVPSSGGLEIDGDEYLLGFQGEDLRWPARESSSAWTLANCRSISTRSATLGALGLDELAQAIAQGGLVAQRQLPRR